MSIAAIDAATPGSVAKRPDHDALLVYPAVPSGRGRPKDSAFHLSYLLRII
jgi:hypothetical protein